MKEAVQKGGFFVFFRLQGLSVHQDPIYGRTAASDPFLVCLCQASDTMPDQE